MTRCLRAKVSTEAISHLTGIETLQVIRDHYDDLNVEDARDELRSVPEISA